MALHGRVAWRRMFAGASIAAALVSALQQDAQAQLADTSPASETVPLQPSLFDFLTGVPVSASMQELAKPKLLRKAFAKLPKTDPKGLAALIKGKEVDVPNRVEAAKYLGRVDCQEFPESQLALKDLLLDEFEPVRYEAARSLQRQFSRGSGEFCFPWEGSSKRKDTCRGCCNTDNIQDVINVMHDQAYGSDSYGCPKEPSDRVRQALAEAINLCVHCDCQTESATVAEPLEPAIEPGLNQDAGESKGTTAPPAPLPDVPKEGDSAAAPLIPNELPLPEDAVPTLGKREAEEFSFDSDLLIGSGDVASARAEFSKVSFESPIDRSADAEIGPLEAFAGACPVSLIDDESPVAGSKQFSTEFKGYFATYRLEFASQEAVEKFKANPRKYFPILDGYCVTTWCRAGVKVKGEYYYTHDGRSYWFAIDKWADDFIANPGPQVKLFEEKLASQQ